MKGSGLAAMRARIQEAFKLVHNDSRDKGQRQVDEE